MRVFLQTYAVVLSSGNCIKNAVLWKTLIWFDKVLENSKEYHWPSAGISGSGQRKLRLDTCRSLRG